MKKTGFIIGVIGIALLNTSAYALDLSLDKTVDMIVAESQDLKKADANVKKAHAQLDAANANRWFKIDGNVTYMNMINVKNPSKGNVVELPPAFGGILTGSAVDGNSNPVTFEIPDNIFMAGVSITQPIYTFGKIGNAVDAVRSAIKMSDAARDLTLREVKYSAADIYWTAKMTDEIVKIAQSDLDAARTAKKRLTTGARANRSNLVKIESDIATKEINLSDAKFNRDTAYRMLKILAGIDMDTEITLTDSFPGTFPEMTAGALADNPQWQVLREQMQMYESKAKSSRAEYLPTLAATASYNFMAMGKEYDAMFEKSGNQSAYWGLALQMPIFSGGLHRANATMDAMDAEAARQDLDKAKKLTTEEYDNAIKKYNHLRDNMATLKEARDLAARAYKYSQERFAAGQTSAIELAEVSAGLYQLDMALLNAKYNILMSAESVKKLGE